MGINPEELERIFGKVHESEGILYHQRGYVDGKALETSFGCKPCTEDSFKYHKITYNNLSDLAEIVYNSGFDKLTNMQTPVIFRGSQGNQEIVLLREGLTAQELESFLKHYSRLRTSINVEEYLKLYEDEEQFYKAEE